MISASFAAQYGIRLHQMPFEDDMPWDEFCALLAGLTENTPLVRIALIRAEDDRERLKHFTKEQHNIRNEWRAKYSPVMNMTEQEKDAAVNALKEQLKKTFSAPAHA